MQNTVAEGRSGEVRRKLEAEAERHPEWRPWLRLLALTVTALEDPAWDAIVIEPVDSRRAAAPWLSGARVRVDAGAASAWVRHLLGALASDVDSPAAAVAGALAQRVDPLRLLEAAIRQDVGSLAVVTAKSEADAGAIAAVAQLAVVPLLHACGRAKSERIPVSWRHGYCPTCGAWPTFAELRGLDRTRRLRCARCAGDWVFSVLRCAFCGETDHKQLGSLVPEAGEPTRKIETCRSCQGYMKTLTTLSATPSAALAFEDLVTVALDLAAQERGFSRPEQPAHRVEVRLEERRVAHGPATLPT